MTPAEVALGLLIGVVSGILSGLFGVGGGIVMTPGIHTLLGTAPLVAVVTPLPVIIPTALTGTLTYRRHDAVDVPAALWMGGTGVLGVTAGWWVANTVDTRILLIVTAVLLAWQSVGIIRGARATERTARLQRSPAVFVTIGIMAGVVSGMLGIGGGLVMVPVLVGWMGMPITTAFGTSLLAIVILAIPGTALHAWSGNIDWGITLAVVIGAVPGAHVGARIALGTKEATLRLLVGSFLLLVALVYGGVETWNLLRG